MTETGNRCSTSCSFFTYQRECGQVRSAGTPAVAMDWAMLGATVATNEQK